MIFTIAAIYTALTLIGIIVNITQIGKPRGPLTGGVVAVSTVASLLMLVAVLCLANAASQIS